MRYMMLIYSKEAPDGLSSEDADQIRAAHWEVIEETSKKGLLLGAEPLAPTTTATTVRMHNGKALVTDGPFAETREQLGGYYLIEAKSLDEATAIAGRIPGAKYGSIEVRPIWPPMAY